MVDTIKPVSVLSEDEVHRLAGTSTSQSGTRDRALILCLYYTALRVSEALSLRTSDMDPERHTLMVREGKGGKSRVVALPPEAWSPISQWLDTRQVDSPWVFSTLRGTQINRRQVDAMLRRHAKRSGITARVHAHGLRHSWAASAVEHGLHVEFIRRQLGHTYLQTTQQYLRGLSEDRFVSAVVQMRG